MANMWEEFDKSFDTEGLAKDVQNSAESGGNFKEVPLGEYEVSIEKMELVSSKAGKPMFSAWFKIVSDGTYKGSLIFMNQVVDEGFKIHIVNDFLRSLKSGHTVNFVTYTQYGNLIMDIHEAISDKYEYALEYSHTKKGFPQFKITDVFELED